MENPDFLAPLRLGWTMASSLSFPKWFSMAIAIILPLGGAVIRLMFWGGWGLSMPFITFYPAVLVAALLGGLIPGLTATALSAVLADFFWMKPSGLKFSSHIDLINILGFLISCTTVSALSEAMLQSRRKMMATLQKSDFLANIIQFGSQPFTIRYPDGRFALANSAFEHLTGYSSGELKSIDWTEGLLPSELQPAERRQVEELLRAGKPVRYEKEYIRKDGSRVPVEILTHLVGDSEGKPQYYYSFLFDISERKKSEEKAARLASIVESSHDAIIGKDLNGKITSWNRGAERIYGYSAKEAIGETISILLPEDSPEEAREILQEVAGSEGVKQYETRRRRKDGELVSVSLSVSPIKAPSGKVIGASTIARDITERKRMEQVARTQRQILEKIFESAPYIMILVNRDGRVMKINSIGAKFSERPKEELLGLLGGEVFNCVHSFSGSGCGRNAQCGDCPVRSIVMHTFETGESIYNSEGCIRVRRQSGDAAFDMLISTVLVHDANSDLVLLTIADITSLKQAERALRESEEQFRSLAESSADIITRYDRKGRYLYVNPAWEKITGIAAHECIGKTLQELGFDNHQREIFEQLIQSVFDSGEPAHRDFEFETASGPMGFDWRAVPEFSANGTVKTVLGVTRDITERVRAERAARRASDELDTIFNSVPATIWYKDTRNNFIRVNQAAADFVGSRPEDMQGKAVVEFFPLEAEKYYQDDLEVLSSGKPKLGIIERGISLWGGERWVRTDKLPIKDADGNITGILAVAVDITDLRQTQQALEQSESRLRFLSAKLLSAHEEERKRIAGELHDSLGSSLTAIKIGLENGRARLAQGEPGADLLDAPIAWTQLTIDEVRRLMADLRPSVLDDMGVIAALQWFIRQYRTTWPGIHVELEVHIEEQDIPEPLRIVIFRITQEAFHNIAKYSKAGYVDFSLVKSNGCIKLTIEDNGEGFDLEAVLSKISERQGLGLTSMQERAELSGGAFTIQSVPGSGTIVNVLWPS
ncbi:MAG: PAS domain S-box protein [Syntrophobacteraceae bacterium]